MELKSPHHGVFTVTHCPTLLELEREGEGREERICQQLELRLFRMQAEFFNPEIQVQGLKLPPRKSKDDVHCQWEFKLEPKIGQADSSP